MRFEFLPVSLAWAAFGRKNGVSDRAMFLQRIRRYRRELSGPDPVIGCLVLTEPFFFGPDAWIAAPADWPRNAVQGKTYDVGAGEGARIWEQVRERLVAGVGAVPSATGTDRVDAPEGAVLQAARRSEPPELALTIDREERWNRVRSRLGQGGFRVAVTGAYKRRCAVTGERTLPALEAAHIRPYAQDGPNDVRNGLLLRSDVHRLFDGGYLTFDPERRLVVSERTRAEFENGREYYRFDGEPLANLPRGDDAPDARFLAWHRGHVFERSG